MLARGNHHFEKCREKSFNGFLKEKVLDFMAIDAFTERTRNCRIFLLSHHHTDHMEGLRSFVEEFNRSSNKMIYTSALTASYLANTYGIDPNKIESLPFNKPLVVHRLEDGSDVSVTCTSAGHCPGSVMFVIEYHGKRILYTGDFRMNLKEFKDSQKYLIKSDGTCREIESLYIDSTFAFPNKMPHRDQSQDLILKVTEEWLLDRANNNKVIIDVHTCIGGEYLFVSLSKAFKTPIAVHEDDFNKFYDNVWELRPYFKIIKDISEENDWLIHACHTNRMGCLKKKGNFQIRMIRPCALGFFQKVYRFEQTIDGVPCVEEKSTSGCVLSRYKIYYSHHSSLEELRDIIKFVAPKHVYPNTVYRGREEEMKQALSVPKPKSTPKKIMPAGDRTPDKKRNFTSKEEYQERKKRRLDKIKKLNLLGD